MLTGGSTNLVERCALTLCNLLQMIGIMLLHHQAHTFLALVADNLFVREGRVADRQFADIDGAAHLLHKF